MEELDIIYEDEVILVCYKPGGIAAQTNKIAQRDMVSLLRNYRAKKGEDTYVGVVHRLDQPVEGIMVFAKTAAAAAHLSKQVAERTIGKKYYAVSEKEKEVKESDILQDYVIFDKKTNYAKVVPQRTPNAKKAELEYRIVQETEQYIFFDITLHTGRHHQIRVQFSHMGCPILGDTKYGRKEERNVQLALCSYQLEFFHPVTQQRVRYELAPHNPVFENLIADSMTRNSGNT